MSVVYAGLNELEVHLYLFVVDVEDAIFGFIYVRQGACWIVFFHVEPHDADLQSCILICCD